MSSPDHDTDLEARLARLRPSALPNDFARGLHAAEPLPASAFPVREHVSSAVLVYLRGVFTPSFRPWRFAYAGVLAAWLLILTFRLATPPPPTGGGGAYQPGTATGFPATGSSSPEFLGSLSANRVALLARHNPPDSALP